MNENKIPTKDKPSIVSEKIATVGDVKRKTAKMLINNAGLFVSAFILFVMATAMTTDIKMQTVTDFASLGLDFFVFIFCSYCMFVNMTDPGKRQGLATTVYKDACQRFDELKAKIISGGYQGKLPSFCTQFVRNEMKTTKTSILASVGITLEKYETDYIGRDKKDISDPLTKPQFKAIKMTNRVKPLKLTPEMILNNGRRGHRRSPLGVNPGTKKNIVFARKFLTTATTSVMMAFIAFDVIIEPDWGLFVSVIFKMLAVVINGFAGYQFGYDHIVTDTVNYTRDQCDLMEQFLQTQNT